MNSTYLARGVPYPVELCTVPGRTWSGCIRSQFWARMGGNRLMFLSHMVFLSLPSSLSVKAMKKCSRVRMKKKERKVRMFQWIREFFSSLSYYFKILILYFINLFCSLSGKKFWFTFMLFLYMFLFFCILMRKYMCSHRKGMKWAADELVTADWFIAISLVVILSTIIICVEDCGG